MSKARATLLCWHSHGAGIEVLEKALKGLNSRKITVAKVLYLVEASEGVETPNECQGAELNLVKVSIADPTNHAQIYFAIRATVIPEVQGLENLHINISPGTPAMHAVWLILHAGGAFNQQTRLWSSQFDPSTKRTRIDPVMFSISTYLKEIRKLGRSDPDIAFYEPEAESDARREALEKLARYSNVPGAPLLILGERGNGKTRLVETYVARLKQRKTVVTIPCGGLDPSLAESILFGHRKGAFTGAVEDREGLLKEADGGILFLDEVQDLPKQLQRKLVRTFQDRKRQFRPVGSDKEESVDAELVCASNLPMDQLRQALDSDLFDRLSHLVVEIPPLRQCKSDIRDDWQRVWGELRMDNTLPAQAPWNAVLRSAMNESDLPGNLRDLQRLASLTMAWWPGHSADDAIKNAVQEWQLHQGTLESAGGSRFGSGSRAERTSWFQRELALWAKEEYGTWEKAAAALNCDERTLRKDANPR